MVMATVELDLRGIVQCNVSATASECLKLFFELHMWLKTLPDAL